SRLHSGGRFAPDRTSRAGSSCPRTPLRPTGPPRERPQVAAGGEYTHYRYIPMKQEWSSPNTFSGAPADPGDTQTLRAVFGSIVADPTRCLARRYTVGGAAARAGWRQSGSIAALSGDGNAAEKRVGIVDVCDGYCENLRMALFLLPQPRCRAEGD